jgi:large subunit ribosomal protein L5
MPERFRYSTKGLKKMKSYFAKKIKQEILPRLAKDLGIKNLLSLPKIEKVTINIGLAKIRDDREAVKKIIDNLAKISGQKPKVIRSKKAIAGFKLKQGETIGIMTTLRGDRMYDFLGKMIDFALPAIRDFKGLNAKFDREGNYNLGIREHAVFPEIKFEDVSHIQSLGVNITISGKDIKQKKALLKAIGLPLKSN